MTSIHTWTVFVTIVSFLCSIANATEQIPALVTYPEVPTDKIILNDSPLEVIECTADGKPNPTFEWFKDGVKLDPEGNVTKAYTNGTLILRDFTDAHNGYYQCKATNRHGVSLSEVIRIRAQVKPKGKKMLDPLIVTEGSPFDLACDNVEPTVPRMEKRWYGVGNKKELPLSDRIGVDTDGTLHFTYTELQDSHEYFCGLVPHSGHKISIELFSRGTLQVKKNTAGSDISSVRPKLLFIKENVKAVLGHTAILECFFASKPSASITWKNSSNHVVKTGDPRFQVVDFGRKLKITKVQQQDEGTFSCTGKNDYGSLEARIEVNVTSPPRAVADGALESQTVPDKRDITLHCKTAGALGETLDTPLWYRNGKFMARNNLPDQSRYRFNSDYSELRITDLNKEVDTASFQCNSSNSEGYEYFDAALRVVNSIKITKQPVEEAMIEHGDVVDMTIQATGDECCNLNRLWYFNNTLIDEPNKWLPFQYDQYSGELVFNSSLVPEDSLTFYLGDYTCRVSNPYQSVDVKVTIGLKGQLEPVTASASIGLWWIGLLCGILAIFIAIIIVIVLYKSNYPRSTYRLEKQELKHNLNPEEELMNNSFHEI